MSRATALRNFDSLYAYAAEVRRRQLGLVKAWPK